MKSKLQAYGFDVWQIEELLKKKTLNTSHGKYDLIGSKLYLIQDGQKKEIEL